MFATTISGNGLLLYCGACIALIASSDLPHQARREHPARQWAGLALAPMFTDLDLNDRDAA